LWVYDCFRVQFFLYGWYIPKIGHNDQIHTVVVFYQSIQTINKMSVKIEWWLGITLFFSSFFFFFCPDTGGTFEAGIEFVFPTSKLTKRGWTCPVYLSWNVCNELVRNKLILNPVNFLELWVLVYVIQYNKDEPY
jgi:hypothetical protein